MRYSSACLRMARSALSVARSTCTIWSTLDPIVLRRYLVGASARFGKSAAVALAETGKIGGPRERGSRRARARDDTLRRGRRDASVNAGERRARAGVAPRSRPARSSLRRLAGEKKPCEARLRVAASAARAAPREKS